ncbi:MAG: uncharacterized protein KVP18_004140 [Porospora cf. gigantea A]|uniref:uncharacterized protein n=1 Tax=Porospora cf. gigantea A TaxID=2853593 RepID=UPI00355A6BAB|nr:MAG: hypothetical protein KVP18_004140 [Porospora cf. gigantea A]
MLIGSHDDKVQIAANGILMITSVIAQPGGIVAVHRRFEGNYNVVTLVLAWRLFVRALYRVVSKWNISARDLAVSECE